MSNPAVFILRLVNTSMVSSRVAENCDSFASLERLLSTRFKMFQQNRFLRSGRGDFTWADGSSYSGVAHSLTEQF